MKLDFRDTIRVADWTEIDRRHHLPTLAEIQAVARARVVSKRRVRDRKRSLGLEAEIERRTMGLLCERQVARLLGVPMQLGVSVRGDGRANLVTAHGVPIDVIGRAPQGRLKELYPDLLLNTRERARPDLALVLVVFFGTHVDPLVAGWEWEIVVRDEARLVAFSSNESFAYPPRKLRPIAELAVASSYVPSLEQVGLFG